MSDVCPSTGKEILTKKGAQRKADWYRRTHFSRMKAYHCDKGNHWHIGNSSIKPKTRKSGHV